MLASGKGRFFIISKDAEALSDFCFAAEQAGILWKAQTGAILCFGLAPAREKAARLLAALSFGPWEYRFLAALARKRYDFFSEEERRRLLQKATRLAREDEFRWGLFAGPQREERLARAYAEQMETVPRLNLEGFARFRLSGYREYLQTLLSVAADEVLSEQEDREYLSLVRGFMSARPPGGEAHLFLLRQDMYDICLNSADGLRFVEGGRLSGCEDMLIYSLVRIAPQTLTLHAEQPLPQSLYRHLRELFGSRLKLTLLSIPAALDKPAGR